MRMPVPAAIGLQVEMETRKSVRQAYYVLGAVPHNWNKAAWRTDTCTGAHEDSWEDDESAPIQSK